MQLRQEILTMTHVAAMFVTWLVPGAPALGQDVPPAKEGTAPNEAPNASDTPLPPLPYDCPKLLQAVQQDPESIADDPNNALALVKCAAARRTRRDCAGKSGSEACGFVAVAPTSPTDGGKTAEVDPEAITVVNVAQSESVAKGCGLVASSVAGAQTGGDAAAMVLAGGLGTYSCEEYLKSAARKDPLLILYPTAIPTVALARDAKDAVADTMKDLNVKGVEAVALAPVIVPIAAFKVGKSVIEKSPALEGVSAVSNAAGGGAVGTAAAIATAPVVVPTAIVVKTGEAVVKGVGKAIKKIFKW